MAVFGAGTSRPLPGRGPSPGFRFTLYAILSIVLMFLDQRRGYLEHMRYYLAAAAYPLQLAVNSPTAAWRWLEASLATREALRAENEHLREQQRTLELRALRFDALARENAELRGLRTALPPLIDHWLPAEVVNVDLNSLGQQRLLINRGARNGVFKGQAVMDAEGLLGQTLHVGPWSAEIILVTDPEHAVPVQITRTGLRTIAVGGGDAESLALPYLPANADVKPGDVLVSSGLGGVFPQGYPVARVTEVRRDAVQPLAHIRATPLAHVDRAREVMLVWFRDDHPAAPASASTGTQSKDLKSGNAALLPQRVPPRAAPSAAPVAPGTAALSAPHPTSAVARAAGGQAASPPSADAVPALSPGAQEPPQ